MPKPLYALFIAASVVLGAAVCRAEVPPGWSFWGLADGMKESFTPSVDVHAGGVSIKHGSVNRINLFDGYHLSEIPDPEDIGQIVSSPDGTLWSWVRRRLGRYRNSRWEYFGVESVTRAGVLRNDTEHHWVLTSKGLPAVQTRIGVVGLDAEHALILLPDQILEFEALGKSSRVVLSSRAAGLGNFKSIQGDAKGKIWITGRRGVGRLSIRDWSWQQAVQPPAGYADFEEPFEGEGGELFVTGSDRFSKTAVLRLDGTRWEVVYTGASKTMRGWRGADKTVWIQDGNRLLHLSTAAKVVPVERTGPLSGIIMSIRPEHDNRFWVGTSHGLAMYMPPLWRTPPEAGDLDDVVSAITEDTHGRVWFLSSHTLICLDGDRWEFFPLPADETASEYVPEGLATLPGDTIAIRTASTDLLTFNVEQRRFRNVKHPAGRDIGPFVQRQGELPLVLTQERAAPDNFALETFDGREFHPFRTPNSSWHSPDLRSFVVGEKGELWAGGSGGLGVYTKDAFSRVGAATGFTESAAFVLKRLPTGKLLAGGRDGLFEYDGKAWHETIHGLDRVRNIATTRDGSVWIASGTGALRLYDGRQMSYGIREGLPSDIIYRVFEDSRGRIWAGSTRGLSLFHPDADTDPPITSISADHNVKEAAPGARVRLVFSGLDKWKFTSSERLLFSWRIDAGKWSAFESATNASLRALRTGAHQFEARAMDRNGNIDPHPASYRFSVLPAWYQTTGFRYLLGASVFVTGLLVFTAFSSYRLSVRKKRVDRDRQEVMEMIVGRLPLATILQRIARAIAENHPGAVGAALVYDAGVIQFLTHPKGLLPLAHTSGRWTIDKDGVQSELAALGLKHGPTIQIDSGNKETLGAMVAIFPLWVRQAKEDTAIMQILSRSASIAIENARLYDQRTLTEARLREARNRLMLATQAGGVGIWDYDVVNDRMVWDDQMFRLYGIDRNKFAGNYGAWQASIHPEDRERGDREIQLALRGTRDFDTEFRVVWTDGSIHSIRAIALAQRDSSERATHIVGTNWDITAQKQAADEIRESNRQLAEATDRANQLAAEASIANAAKSEFLATMSHEIRTPMNGVIGMTGLLLDTELSEEQRHYAETVRASGEALLMIINDVLDFSKIEANKLDLETLDFDLQSLLDDFAATLAVQANKKGLELFCRADPTVPAFLQGDPGRLRQILTNLTGNAIKFTEKGEVAVRVSLESGNEADCLLRFAVRDTGIGIPADKIGMLFAKFSQVDSSTTRKYGGTGLGLAISKQLAGKMGGEVGFTSEAGKGSEFWFTVRLGIGKQSEGAQADAGIRPDLRGVRALIVDDNATSREILSTLMSSWGMRPVEVEDGQKALQALNMALDVSDPFQVAVIDMQMPGMDGETLGRAIKADLRLASTRMVMLTSMGARGDARRVQDLGFAAYATKPIRQQEFRNALMPTQRSGTAPEHSIARKPLDMFAGRTARILLGEGNITNQLVALGLVRMFGLHADAVANGAEAVKALENIPYDLVLMDVQMPVMDGFEATREIRDPESAVRNHDIPIIAMTANAMQGDRELCLASGMNDYVAKPVSPQALRGALQKWLGIGDGT